MSLEIEESIFLVQNQEFEPGLILNCADMGSQGGEASLLNVVTFKGQ